MTRMFAAVCSALLLIAPLEIRAQTPAPAPRPQSPRPQRSTPSMPKRQADLSVTVVGCLVPWSAAVAGQPAAPAGSDRPAPDHRFVLTDAEPADSKPPAAGTVVSAPVEVSRYIVTAVGGVDLAAHVNQKVRIAGIVIDDPAAPMLAEPADDAPAPADPPPAPAPRTTRPGSAAPPWPSLVAASLTRAGGECKPGTW